MAKARIPPSKSWDEVAAALREMGITLDRHRLPDGSFRAYVRKDHMERFLSQLQTINERRKHGQAKDLQDCRDGPNGCADMSGDCLGAPVLQRHEDHHDAEPVLPTRRHHLHHRHQDD